MGVTYVSRTEALEVVASRVEDVEVVLDIGPGICPQPFIKKPYVHICVDAHRPYLERVKKEVADDPKYVFINSPWEKVIGMLPDKSVDTVFALDFIEHLEKEDGLRMLREAERVARHQIVVYTPHGFFPQSYEDPEKPDRWGMDGGYWQTHRSGWEFEDFGEEWEFICCPDFLDLDEDNQPLEKPMGAIWAFRNLSPAAERRYHVMEDDSAWAHVKRMLERGLPPAAYKGLRSAWLSVTRPMRRAPASRGEGAGGAR
ncbi:MAG TPA: class I SAM-dependent methyltransferase [Pyrinomonadaceae bacterium]|nr:class I SAM-dependent methyltransferase [Pyrinomonadaceae bacterium]